MAAIAKPGLVEVREEVMIKAVTSRFSMAGNTEDFRTSVLAASDASSSAMPVGGAESGEAAA